MTVLGAVAGRVCVGRANNKSRGFISVGPRRMLLIANAGTKRTSSGDRGDTECLDCLRLARRTGALSFCSDASRSTGLAMSTIGAVLGDVPNTGM